MISHFDENTLVLTVNTRLSNYLRAQYDQSQIDAKKSTWPTLQCLPLDVWVPNTIEDILNTHVILNDAQELALWKSIISQTDDPTIVYQAWKIAEIAQNAWQLLKQWQLPLTTLSEYTSEDTQSFFIWATQFNNLCHKQNWMTSSDCIDVLISTLASQAITLPSKIMIAGFDEFTPQIKRLVATLKKYCHVDFYESNAHASVISRTLYTNEDEEITHMAVWAKNILTHTPRTKIACVVPHLNSIRHKIHRIFTEVFASDDQTSTNKTATEILDQTAMPFNISMGYALSKSPLIQTALQILSLNAKEISLLEVSTLLCSPFIGAAHAEMIQRAQLHTLLFKTEERALTLSTVIHIAQKNSLAAIWIHQLQNFLKHLPLPHEKNYLSVWIQKITTLLNIMGWSGDRNLNSDEYQQFQRWQKLLIEFTQLTIVHSHPIHFDECVHYLKILTQKTLFQSQTETAAPLQILGILETAGMTFDHLWVMGMNDDKWPIHSSPNPFIPLHIQRRHHMPHSSHEQTYLFGETLTTQLQKCAKYIHFSYSQQKDDMPLRMSQLIQNIPETPLTHTTHEPTVSNVELEIIQDDIGPFLKQDEKIRGGANILKDQAACPFRAFAKYRLGATTIPTLASGLSHREKGNLVHEILEKIWHILQNQHTLESYEEEKLNTLIHQTISSLLDSKTQFFPFTLKQRFVELEHQRLFTLIKNWLLFEKQRPPFEVISNETAKQIDFHGLNLRLRIDREDKLCDGRHMIIDYKTGKTSINSWFGDRPDDPQLPLYCLTHHHSIEGLLFAQIHSDKLQFRGISSEACDIEGVETISQLKIAPEIKNWDTFVLTQKQTLAKITLDFQEGKANVDPKNLQETCKQCDLQSFCRIYDGAYNGLL